MMDFIEYVVSELKQKRLSKGDALSLIEQFSQNGSNGNTLTTIHPLLHVNTSNLYQQSYSTFFSGQEPFLEDHQVRLNGDQLIKVLPGAAYLEMVRAAMENASPNVTESSILELRDIMWLRPFFVTENNRVDTILTIGEDENTLFQIYSPASDYEAQIVHFEGQLDFRDRTAIPALDIAKLKGEMNQGELTSERIYAAYDAMGLVYGPAHRVVTNIYKGNDQLVARLHLPKGSFNDSSDYRLHPSLMDGALQSSIGLLPDLGAIPENPMVPFALEKIQVLSPCTEDMYVWVRYSEGSGADNKIVKLDIDISDSEGTVCIRMEGFSSKAFLNEATRDERKESTLNQLLAAQIWEPSDNEMVLPKREAKFVQEYIIMCDFPPLDAEQIAEKFSGVHCSFISFSSKDNSAVRYQHVALSCFQLIQDIMKAKLPGKASFQLVIAHTRENEVFTGLSGMLRTAMLENPRLWTQIVLLPNDRPWKELVPQLRFEQTHLRDTVVKYENGVRHLRKLKEIEFDGERTTVCLKENGAYLITGGLGGLGILFAKEILLKTKDTKVILTGRSELTLEKKTVLKTLTENTGRVEYLRLDVANFAEVQAVMDTIIKKHKKLNGIFHSAGMVSDNFILKKSSKEFTKVLEPKVIGTFNLDTASQKVGMDFLVLFSSGVSLLGNVGQADYAAANGFLDQFARYKNRLGENRKTKKKLYAINWPLWETGGMALDQTMVDTMKRETGIHPIKTATGLAAFYKCLELDLSQILVLEGDLQKVRQRLFEEETMEETAREVATSPPITSAPIANTLIPNNLLEKTREYLRKQFSTVLKISINKIDTAAALEKYGIDSVVAMNLTGQLEKTFGKLSKTLFFEYQTIDELSEYISRNFQETLLTLFSIKSRPAPLKEAPAVPKKSRSLTVHKPKRRLNALSKNKESRYEKSLNDVLNEPIAIVGLSGRYPESMNIGEFWSNLRDGKDCVTEVPKERWDWNAFYSQDKTSPGAHSSKWGGFISGVDEFDPRFFNISPREASYIDPQERLFLEHAWMAIEDAGFTRERLQIPAKDDQAAQVGVYVGVMYGEYNLSGSLASIANRVSYALNLHGPSMTLDTMCSSSLTAIHLACQDIKLGRTDLAIAGGVNVSIDANKYRMLSSSQFLSSDGHCQSFGEGGDGYIPGEGVGAVVLKRLSEAKRDKNQIYGIIKGSTLNHGGKTNGYTVPNPQAQASAISRVLRESRTDPRHISYIEAHGTGTKLGDPIEIAALTKAFGIKEGEGHCLVGSAKSNIGHCESAAGIAGLTKVLLQMKHHQIVPSLHSARLNPNIDFGKTPFEVNQTLKKWERPIIDGKQVPRLAGLSSFGAGGSNAHLILQEYDRTEEENSRNDFVMSDSFALVPLSARTTAQLQQKARELYQYVEMALVAQHDPSQDKLSLFELAYTLQIGREAMEERLGFIVSTLEELVEKLKAYARGETDIEDMYQGQVRQNRDTISLFDTDADFKETIDKWVLQKKYTKIIDLWVKGLNLDWATLYEQEKFHLISLPAYPFAREKYWNGPELRGKVEMKDTGVSVLHPLLHSNTSTLEHQSFSTTFSGNESFVNDYQLKLNGATAQKALPAMAIIEMARAAVAHSKPSSQEYNFLELREIAWGSPFILNGNKKIDISLYQENDGQIDFEIYSNGSGNETIHSQGRALFLAKKELRGIDLEHLKGQLQKEIRNIKEVYEQFRSLGFHYGPTNQVMTSIYKSERGILAKLRLPQTPGNGRPDFVLPPSMLDSVVQASLCLLAHSSMAARHLLVPVSADFLTIHKVGNKDMYVWVQHMPTAYTDGNSLRVDASLCDVDGVVCAEIRGLRLQQIEYAHMTQTDKSVNIVNVMPVFTTPKLKKPDAVTLNDFNGQTVENTNSVKPKDIVLIDYIELHDSPRVSSPSEIKGIALPQEAVRPGNNIILKEMEFVDHDIVLDAYDELDDLAIVKPTELATLHTLEQVKLLLIDTLADCLYMEPAEIEADRSFVDLGLDSIMGVEWIKTINKKLDLELSSTKVYDYATVNKLAKYLWTELSKNQGTLSGDQAISLSDSNVTLLH